MLAGFSEINAGLRNKPMRTCHSRAADGRDSLRPLGVQLAGGAHTMDARPPMMADEEEGVGFPPTVRAARNLSHRQIDYLAAFYGEDFGDAAVDQLVDMREKFYAFIGLPP
jgi:hypothetical protein